MGSEFTVLKTKAQIAYKSLHGFCLDLHYIFYDVVLLSLPLNPKQILNLILIILRVKCTQGS